MDGPEHAPYEGEGEAGDPACADEAGATAAAWLWGVYRDMVRLAGEGQA